MRRSILIVAFLLIGTLRAQAQNPAPCRFLCAPEFKVEPTVTFGNLFGAPRIQDEQGRTVREPRETDFELILSFGLPTRVSWLEFTVEGIVLPFDRESTPELEFETNVIWLPAERTRGWVSSHFDVVDKFSPAERPTDRRAYTHKLNFEFDTSVAVFNWLPEGRGCAGSNSRVRWTTSRTACPNQATAQTRRSTLTRPVRGPSPSYSSFRLHRSNPSSNPRSLPLHRIRRSIVRRELRWLTSYRLSAICATPSS